MIPVDRMISIPYCVFVMLRLYRNRNRLSPVVVSAAILVFVVPLCLVTGGMASHDSCWDLGPAPGLCGKAVGQPHHFVADPASLINPLVRHETSVILFQPVASTVSSFGVLSTPDGRAPPLV